MQITKTQPMANRNRLHESVFVRCMKWVIRALKLTFLQNYGLATHSGTRVSLKTRQEPRYSRAYKFMNEKLKERNRVLNVN